MFIELTDYKTGKKVLINAQWIEEIIDTEYYRIIYFAFQSTDAYEQDNLKVNEEYQEIKHLLGVE